MKSFFDEILQTASGEGPQAAVARLVDHLRQAGQYPELFEALKMQKRLELGLTAVGLESDPPLSPENMDAIESGLIAGCH